MSQWRRTVGRFPLEQWVREVFGFVVKESDDTEHQVPLKVLDSDGNEFTVPKAALDSDGNSFTV